MLLTQLLHPSHPQTNLTSFYLQNLYFHFLPYFQNLIWIFNKPICDLRNMFTVIDENTVMNIHKSTKCYHIFHNSLHYISLFDFSRIFGNSSFFVSRNRSFFYSSIFIRIQNKFKSSNIDIIIQFF